MWAHIIFDFPRALRSAFDSSSGRGLSWNDLHPDFKRTETMFSTAMENSIQDIRSTRGWGWLVSLFPALGGGFAFVTEKGAGPNGGNRRLHQSGSGSGMAAGAGRAALAVAARAAIREPREGNARKG
jgi:hypothetical protein